MTSPSDIDATGTTTDITANTQAINAALRAALEQGVGNRRGGPCILGPGKYLTNDTIEVPHGAHQYASLSFGGYAGWSTEIAYSGPTDGRPAIRLNKQKLFDFGSLSITRSDEPRGKSVGVLLSSDVGAGTQVLSGQIHPLCIQGFGTGMQLGEDTPDGRHVRASEMNFQHLQLQDCDVGLFLYGQNTLNILIQLLNTWLCGVGLKTIGASNIAVILGAGAQNLLADFDLGTGSPNASIHHWRTERVRRVLLSRSASVTLDHVQVADYAAGHDGRAIEMNGQVALTLSHSNLRTGTIHAPQGGTHLEIVNSQVGGSQYLYPLVDGSSLARNTVTARNGKLGGISTGPEAKYAGADSGVLARVA